jgi:hypothetical protein
MGLGSRSEDDRDRVPGRALTRRHLLAGLGLAGVASVLGPPWWVRWATAAPVAGGTAPGATAADPVHALLQAYVSTLVPGPGDDPSGAPGAVEAGAVEQLQAHVPYVVPELVADLTGAALVAHGRPFPALSYAEREALLVAAFADPTRSTYHLIGLAIGAGSFYGDFVNRVGGTWMGFPGPSDGYLHSYTDRTGHGQPQADAVPA